MSACGPDGGRSSDGRPAVELDSARHAAPTAPRGLGGRPERAGVVQDARAVAAPAIPGAFEESVAFSGLRAPVAVRFAPDGTVFVAEKHGVVKRYAGLGDATPETVADVSAAVHDYWDRGLIGLAVDPGYPARPTSTCPTPGTTWRAGRTTARPRPARRIRAASSTGGSCG